MLGKIRDGVRRHVGHSAWNHIELRSDGDNQKMQTKRISQKSLVPPRTRECVNVTGRAANSIQSRGRQLNYRLARGDQEQSVSEVFVRKAKRQKPRQQ